MISLVLLTGVASAGWTPFSADPTRPATTSSTLMVAETTERPPLFDARANLAWTHNPLVVYGTDGEPSPWIGDTLTLHLSAAGGWGPLRFAVSEPIAAARGEGLDEGVAAAGDPQLSARLAWRGDAAGVGLGWDLTLPFGADQVWLGESGRTLRVGVLADGRAGALLGALNVGLSSHPEVPLDASENEGAVSLTGGLWARGGASWDLRADMAVSLEIAASTGSEFGEDQTTPLEALLGTTFRRGDSQVRVAAGVGVLPGVGAPAARLLVGVGQRPTQSRERPPEIVEVPAPEEAPPEEPAQKE